MASLTGAIAGLNLDDMPDINDIPEYVPGTGSSTAGAGPAAAAAATTAATTADAATAAAAATKAADAAAKAAADDDANFVNRLQSGDGLRVNSGMQSTFDSKTPFETLARSATEPRGIPQDLLTSIRTGAGFDTMSAIQKASIPRVLGTGEFAARKNVVVQAKNGSGKTMSFTIGSLAQIDRSINKPQVLVLGPARELTVQNYHVALQLTDFTEEKVPGVHATVPGKGSRLSPPIKCRAILKGEKITGKITEHYLTGTVGIIQKWIKNRKLDTSALKVVVLDEADRMMEESSSDSGGRGKGGKGGKGRRGKRISTSFFNFVNDLKKRAPNLQWVLYSATYSEEMKAKVQDFCGSDAHQIFLAADDSIVLKNVKQFFIRSPSKALQEQLLVSLYRECQKLDQTIIFVKSKADLAAISAVLKREGLQVTAMSSILTGAQRDAVMAQFKAGLTKTLITTDVLARGVDVPNVTHVINYGLALKDYDGNRREMTYQQRVGRAGRFGRKGCCINLVCSDAELQEVERIQDALGMRGVVAISEVDRDDDEEWSEKFSVVKGPSGPGESKN